MTLIHWLCICPDKDSHQTTGMFWWIWTFADPCPTLLGTNPLLWVFSHEDLYKLKSYIYMKQVPYMYWSNKEIKKFNTLWNLCSDIFVFIIQLFFILHFQCPQTVCRKMMSLRLMTHQPMVGHERLDVKKIKRSVGKWEREKWALFFLTEF